MMTFITLYRRHHKQKIKESHPVTIFRASLNTFIQPIFIMLHPYDNLVSIFKCHVCSWKFLLLYNLLALVESVLICYHSVNVWDIYIYLQEIVEADGLLIRHGVNKKTMEPNTSHFALIHSL